MEIDAKEKDNRLPKQLGDFGESLVMFVVGSLKEYRVALVDHEGADLIATDRVEDGKKYAISVKSRRFKKDDPSFVFDENNQKKLRTFAKEFDMIPAVAFVLMDAKDEDENIDIYIMELDKLKELASSDEKNGFCIRKQGGLTVNNAKKHQLALQNCEGVSHTRFVISKLDKKLFNY